MGNKSGFSVIELMVVIAIIGIITAISIPNIMTWRQNLSYNASLQRTISVMHSAKAHAVKENVPAVVRFDTGSHSFRAFVDNNFDNAWTPGIDREIDSYEMPSGVRITQAAFAGGAPWFRFNGRGMPNGFGGSVELTSDRGLSNDVVVNITGRIRVD